MIVITGSREVKTGVGADKQPIMKTVVTTADIPDEPKKLSDFPKGTLAFTSEPREDGTVGVVTVDGKRFYVADDRTKAEKKAEATK